MKNRDFSLLLRPRRLRRSKAIRQLVAETSLDPGQFVLPVFVTEGHAQREPISTMPGQFRYSIDELLKLALEARDLGVRSFALFPQIEENKKDSFAKESTNPDGLLQRAVKELKNKLPDSCIITDVAMDPYSSDGHDGVVVKKHLGSSANYSIDNDATLEVLGAMALVQARSGADFVAPSDMMDGRVGHIRKILDAEGFTDVGIISYAAKYASNFYGPFRDALGSAPKEGDKKTYQMDYRNQREALHEVRLDVAEGADVVMVKPALAYLDVISQVAANSPVPVAAYNVSGEYSMLKLAAQNGLIDESAGMLEILTAIARAGAKIIFTYHALEAARLLSR